MAGVAQHPEDQFPGLRIHQLRHRAVEVSRDPIAHVRLDQPFQPVGWGGPGVEGIQRRRERQHRRLRLGAQRRQMLPEQPEMAELGHGHAAQRGLVRERGSQRGVLGQLEERDELAVGEQPEQIQDAVRARIARRAVAWLCLGHPRSVQPGRGASVHAPRRTHWYTASSTWRECGGPLAVFFLAVRLVDAQPLVPSRRRCGSLGQADRKTYCADGLCLSVEPIARSVAITTRAQRALRAAGH